MPSSSRRRMIGILCILLLVGVYLSWQFGLFAQPHRATPIVEPEPRAPVENSASPPKVILDPWANGAQPDKEDHPRTSKGRQNILLLGIDARAPGQQTRSDIMLLLSIDLANREAALLSIPRDSRVEIPGRGLDKINHAHAFGGVDLALRTVANAFQVPIHHWVRIDMTGMVELIDQVGPITVEVPYPLTLPEGVHLNPGPVQMDGDLALLYLRERYSDPEGDVGRTERAQGFLLDLGRELAKEVGASDLPRLFTILRTHAETDIRLQDGFWQRAMGIDLDQVTRGTVEGRGIMLDGIYYYEIDWPATEGVLQSLQIRPAQD